MFYNFQLLNVRLTKPDEEQSCSKLLLLNISNKPTQNENLQLTCLGSLECIQIENPSSIKETNRNVTSLLVDTEFFNIMVNFFGQRVLK